MLWQFITWWCSLFGITDATTIQMVGGVVVGGLGLLAIGALVAFSFAVFAGVVAGLRRT